MQRVRAETAWLLVTKRDMFLPTQLDPVDQFDPYSCHFLLVVTVISGDSGYYKWSLCVSAVLFVENTEIPEITSGRMCFCPAEEVGRWWLVVVVCRALFRELTTPSEFYECHLLLLDIPRPLQLHRAHGKKRGLQHPFNMGP